MPLWATLRAVTAPLLPVRVVFQELVTLWPEGRVKVSAQPLTGLLPVLATVTLATKPLFHDVGRIGHPAGAAAAGFCDGGADDGGADAAGWCCRRR